MESFYALIGEGRHEILWWQECIRAILVLLYGLVLIRVAGRRAFGRQTPLDIVLAVIIGSNLSRTLTANAPFFPTLAGTAVLVAVYWITSHLTQRSKLLGWLVKGSPVWLIHGGKLDSKAADRSGVSKGDLEEAMRARGVDELSKVRTAVLERNGKISVIRGSGAAA
jgi:uncharacterized membrane protein YcaP (DUF421 family)